MSGISRSAMKKKKRDNARLKQERIERTRQEKKARRMKRRQDRELALMEADGEAEVQEQPTKPVREHHYQKNDVVSLSIRDIGSGGEGIGQVDGYTLFVKDAVIGDVVEARITKPTKHYAWARLERVLRPSPDRIRPRCPISRQCGGCQIQTLAYDRQLSFKQNKVRADLLRIGGFSEELVDRILEPIVGMEEPWHYRSKELVPVGEREGVPVAGFYAGRTHDIVPMSGCKIGRAQNQEIIETALAWMQNYAVEPYDEQDGSGIVRHILIRDGVYSGQVMVCIVANAPDLPHERELVEALRVLPGVTSISLNTNMERTNVVMGRVLRTLWGTPDIEDTLHILKVREPQGSCTGKQEAETKDTEERSTAGEDTEKKGTAAEDAEKRDAVAEKRSAEAAKLFVPTGEEVTFRISPLSFYQVNPRQTERLYSIALDFAGLTGSEVVWDLYCGVGTISLFLARHARAVYGVEIIPQAVENARENAQRNHIANARFYTGKAEEVLPDYVAGRGYFADAAEAAAVEDPGQVDVIVVDPPRKGCDAKCLETMLEIGPERIVYVSCDPATMARDLRILADGGYELQRVRPVDQFPQTVHVETVVLLSRENK